MLESEQIELIIRRAVKIALLEHSESHPRPNQVNMVQAAQMLGISRATVSKMVSSGVLKLNQCGLINIKQIDEVLTNV